MIVAIVGSRDIILREIDKYIPSCDEIVSGGAMGVDTCAEEYAERCDIPITVFKPEYNLFGKAAPIIRNKKIVDYADKIIAFWNGKSRGTHFIIEYARKMNKPCEVIVLKPNET